MSSVLASQVTCTDITSSLFAKSWIAQPALKRTLNVTQFRRRGALNFQRRFKFSPCFLLKLQPYEPDICRKLPFIFPIFALFFFQIFTFFVQSENKDVRYEKTRSNKLWMIWILSFSAFMKMELHWKNKSLSEFLSLTRKCDKEDNNNYQTIWQSPR